METALIVRRPPRTLLGRIFRGNFASSLNQQLRLKQGNKILIYYPHPAAAEPTVEFIPKCPQHDSLPSTTWIIPREELHSSSTKSTSIFHRWRAGRKKSATKSLQFPFCWPFYKHPFLHLRFRAGTNVDSENLSNTLRNLHFDVSIYKDFKNNEMMQEINDGLAEFFSITIAWLIRA